MRRELTLLYGPRYSGHGYHGLHCLERHAIVQQRVRQAL